MGPDRGFSSLLLADNPLFFAFDVAPFSSFDPPQYRIFFDPFRMPVAMFSVYCKELANVSFKAIFS